MVQFYVCPLMGGCPNCFFSNTLNQQREALFRIGKGEPPPVPETLSNDARDFILKCVQVNPDDRPTAAQLLNHPFARPLPGTLGSTSPYPLGRR